MKKAFLLILFLVLASFTYGQEQIKLLRMATIQAHDSLYLFYTDEKGVSEWVSDGDTIMIDTTVTVAGISSYKEELTAPKTVFSVGFTLTASSTVYFNGALVNDVQWSGEGTSTLTLALDTKQYDYLTVIK